MFTVEMKATEVPRFGHDVRLDQAELSTFIEQAPEGIFVADLEGRCSYVNQAGCGLLGYSRDELKGKKIGDLIPAQDAERFARFRAAMREGRAEAAEWTFRRKDGARVPVEANAKILPDGRSQWFVRDISQRTALRDGNGDVAGVDEDITALHEAQEKQRASEQLFRAVFDLLPVGLWIADHEGIITEGNPAGQRIWQGTRFVGPDQYNEFRGWWVETGKPIAPDEWGIARAISKGETSRRELIRIQCFDGSFKTVINWATPIRSDSGEIAGAVAVNEDITALHQAQEQLRAAVRDREDILAVVTHDLRSPLSAIRMMAATIELKSRALPGGEPVRALTANLIDVARQMSALVNDLLTVAVMKTDRSGLKIAAIKGSELLEKATASARPLFAREGIQFEVQVVGELPVIQADSDRILRVLANLLDNARKFTAPDGEVLLLAEAQSAGVRYSVVNSGPALSANELDSMFQPFWQAGRGDLRGTGLGLSICRSIVQAHGGSIWAEPVAGKRVRVCFLLPCTNPAAFAAALA